MDRISCVIVDDDKLSMEALIEQCQSMPYVDVVGNFKSPQDFIKLLPTLKFDICLFGLNMPDMSGLQVAKQLDGQSIIFIADEKCMLKDALEMSPIDIVLKPMTPLRFKDAMAKGYHQLNGQRKIHRNGKEFELLKVDGVRGKVKFRLADILYIHSDKDDPRHKYVISRDGSTQRVVNFQHKVD